MQVTHIVLLQFKVGVTPENKAMVATKVRNLRDECRHPKTGKDYIISLTAGTDVSIEGLQNGMEFAFVAVFASLEDRDYYVNHDKAHLGLVQNVGQYLEKVQVFDFIDGKLV